MKPTRLRTVAGAPSWTFRNRTVEASLTRAGGQLGPVSFRLGRRWISPYSVAPWAEEKLPASTPPIIRVLRGDFFCCPFGGNDTPWRGEKHPVHGESANNPWTLGSVTTAGSQTTLTASLRTTIRPGRIEKEVTLVEGHSAVYVRHTLSGLQGPMNFGHHAMLKFPAAPGSGLLSVSPFLRGQVFPGTFERPELGGYVSLKAGATFRSLGSVPLLSGGTTDLARYPARRGFEDLVMVSADPKLPFAWTAVVFPAERYVWFALRNPRILRHTVLWISNAGRHYAPWSGRHSAVMGLEDVTSYFHYGLSESVSPNPVSRAGLPTSVKFKRSTPYLVPYIMGVAALPPRFAAVASIAPAAGGIRPTSERGQSVTTPLHLGFLA